MDGMRSLAAVVLSVAATVLLVGCGSSSPDTVRGVAKQIGCTGVHANSNAMHYPEVTCRLNGAQVDITDWSQATKTQRDGLLGISIGMGYQVIDVGHDITAGSESMRVAKKIARITHGGWLSAS